jgi:hypothetical protein
MTYNKILVPLTPKPYETALENAITIAKMSRISSNTIIKIILVYVVQNIPVPATFGIGLFKSKKIGT